MPGSNSKVADDPYRALNLDHHATASDIKSSYRQLAKKYHPDTWSAPCFSQSEKDHATRVFQQLAQAHAVLSDPTQKAAYDRDYKLGVYPHHGRPQRNDNPPKTVPQPQKTTAQPSHPRVQVRPPTHGAPPPLPKGWTTAIDPSTGSVYYCQASTGKSSWTHPLSWRGTQVHSNTVPTTPQRHRRDDSEGFATGFDSGFGKKRPKAPPLHHDYNDMEGYGGFVYDRAIRTSDEPDAHRCGAFLALVLCPPLGILACYHSILADQCWQQKLDLEKLGGTATPNDPLKDEDDVQNSPQRQSDLAHGHSQRAGGYACAGILLGILLWAYVLAHREGEGGDHHENRWWPEDWKLGEWFDEWGKNEP